MHGKCKKYANKNIDDLSNEVWAMGSLRSKLWTKAGRNFKAHDIRKRDTTITHFVKSIKSPICGNRNDFISSRFLIELITFIMIYISCNKVFRKDYFAA